MVDPCEARQFPVVRCSTRDLIDEPTMYWIVDKLSKTVCNQPDITIELCQDSSMELIK